MCRYLPLNRLTSYLSSGSLIERWARIQRRCVGGSRSGIIGSPAGSVVQLRAFLAAAGRHPHPRLARRLAYQGVDTARPPSGSVPAGISAPPRHRTARVLRWQAGTGGPGCRPRRQRPTRPGARQRCSAQPSVLRAPAWSRTPGQQGPVVLGGVGGEHSDLAVVTLPRDAGVLPRHASR